MATKHRVTLGVVCLARKTFDWEAAADIYGSIRKDLAARADVDWVFVDELVIEPEDARAAAERLIGRNVDGLVCISGTFHLGHLVLEIEKQLRKPILLWGLDELPYNGGKIRLNSVCGVNLNASNLYKAGVRNYTVTIGARIDEDWIDAIRILSRFRRAHVGILGYRAHGFFNLGVYDPNVYQQLGILIDHYELEEVWAYDVRAADIEARRKQLTGIFDVSGITDKQLAKVAELSAKLQAFLDDKKLDAMAVRCWPEFAAGYGISPCAAMSLLQSEDRILACEGDLEGALSMVAHRAIGAETPFLFDFSQVNFEENFALFWHCGVAPCNLWDGKCVRSLDTYFAGGKGVTADFVLKSGELSILRIDSAGTEYRLFIQKAAAIPMDKELKGTYMKATFDLPVRQVLDKIIDNGFAHHASVVYGDFMKPFRILAKITGWKLVE
ncbi:MAG TPA: fucose isomerase [Rectinemataceae bacterium]|nr:fucose isomerase [Rectinemataceae bacterium]